MNITTTEGEIFTYEQTADLAAMVYNRFGRNLVASTAAWRRLMQNDTSMGEFRDLLINVASRAEQNKEIAHILRGAADTFRGIAHKAP